MSNWNRKSGAKDELDVRIIPQQNINITLVTAPTISLVTRSEVKNYLKMGSDTTDDTLIDGLITAATGIIEREAGGIALCTQTWKQTQTGGVDRLKLLRQPIIGVPTISYYDDFDDTTAVNITYTSYFKVIQPNTLVHTDGYFEEGRDSDGYEITFDCGMYTASNYTSSADPRLNMFKYALLRTIAWLYEQREEYVDNIKEGQWTVNYAYGLPEGIKRLIMPLHSGEGLI